VRVVTNARRLAAVLVGVMMGACSGATPSPSATAPGSSGAPERAALTIGLLPIVDVAPIHLAIERGLFAAQGLAVTVEVVQGGAAAIPALVGGDLDIAYGNWVSFLLANHEGIELRAIAGGVAAAPGFTELLALPESGLAGKPAAMAGRVVAVNTLNNVGELAVRVALRAARIDPAEVRLVEIPFPDMGAALERGDVDVIWASEPVPTIVKSELGAVVVADSFTGELEGFPVAGYQATADFVAANPRTVAAFQRALAAAVALIEADPSLVAGIVPGYTALDADLAAQIALPAYASSLEPATLRRVQDTALEVGILESALEVDALVATPEPGG
jgi:NitT/TauT family transport system substrate-binding protein